MVVGTPGRLTRRRRKKVAFKNLNELFSKKTVVGLVSAQRARNGRLSAGERNGKCTAMPGALCDARSTNCSGNGRLSLANPLRPSFPLVLQTPEPSRDFPPRNPTELRHRRVWLLMTRSCRSSTRSSWVA
jgi:hypothetical protein